MRFSFYLIRNKITFYNAEDSNLNFKEDKGMRTAMKIIAVVTTAASMVIGIIAIVHRKEKE